MTINWKSPEHVTWQCEYNQTCKSANKTSIVELFCYLKLRGMQQNLLSFGLEYTASQVAELWYRG